ncbi:MAG: uridine kinase [Parcubacteria group bacterium]
MQDIIETINSIKPKHSQSLIGIDGLGASGKTVFARKLADKLSNVSVVAIDDFIKPLDQRTFEVNSDISSDYDWDRLQKEVFDSIIAGKQIKYQKFDWDKDKLDKWIEIPKDNIIIVEGVYSTQPRFRNLYDYTIWISMSRDKRIENMINREGRETADKWQRHWMPKEDKYFETRPDKKVDKVV